MEEVPGTQDLGWSSLDSRALGAADLRLDSCCDGRNDFILDVEDFAEVPIIPLRPHGPAFVPGWATRVHSDGVVIAGEEMIVGGDIVRSARVEATD
jgi:hypothetical protein